MCEYIEREALINRLLKVSVTDDLFGMGAQFGTDHAIQVINEAPAADVAPILRADGFKIGELAHVRHGKWILQCDARRDFVTGEYDEDYYLECSECHRKVFDISQDAVIEGRIADIIKAYPYCHCGCKMDGDSNV